MPDNAISVEHLSKKFHLGMTQSGSFREIMENLRDPKAKEKDEFWALRDVNFTVKQGEVVGIIGKNGAGKSTLLKILSRITPPTEGKITYTGRIASLLEVGTGFHPELSGMENIFLNGTILGMTRKEISVRLEEIINFSGIEKFINTPVKRYSSGMYVRLAFAVAAHLEPEILIIDEVLAVGDAEFQRKCLGKMKDVSTKDGRTVLFVSHNMGAVSKLCTKGIFLKNGQVNSIGPVEDIIGKYSDEYHSADNYELNLVADSLHREVCKNNIRLTRILFNRITYAANTDFEMQLLYKKVNPDFVPLSVNISIFIVDDYDNHIYRLDNAYVHQQNLGFFEDKAYTFYLPQLRLKQGIYMLHVHLTVNNELEEVVSEGININVLSDNIYHFSNSEHITGKVQPDFEFYLK